MKNPAFIIAFLFGLTGALTVNAQRSSLSVAREWTTFQKIDDSLQHVYSQVLEEYSSKPLFIEQLKKSQALWKEMREADMLMRFPRKNENPNFYGSAFSDCYYMLATDYTRKRIAFLNQWLEGIPEGDVCTGSIRFK